MGNSMENADTAWLNNENTTQSVQPFVLQVQLFHALQHRGASSAVQIHLGTVTITREEWKFTQHLIQPQPFHYATPLPADTGYRGDHS